MRLTYILCALLVATFFSANSAFSVTKRTNIAFKLPKAISGLSYCGLERRKWRAGLGYSKGKIVLPSKTNLRADSTCRAKAARMLKASTTYVRTVTRRRGRGSAASAASAAVREVTRIDPLTGDPYILYFLADIELSAIVGLPNGYSLVIPSQVPTTIGGVACRVGLLSPTAEISCVPPALVGYFYEGFEVNEFKMGRSVQTDSAGNVYFWAMEYEGEITINLIKMSPAGEFSIHYTASSEDWNPRPFLVNGDGSIILVRYTSILEPSIHRLNSEGIESTVIGNTRSIAGLGLGYIAPFFGGGFLAGISNFSGSDTTRVASDSRIILINASGESYENLISRAEFSPTGASLDSLCDGAGSELTALCGYGGTYISSYHTTSDAVYLVVAQPGIEGSASNLLVRITGTSIAVVPLVSLAEPFAIAGVGDQMIIAGKTSTGGGRIIHLNGITSAESVLVNGMTIEKSPSTLFYSKSSGQIVARGRRDRDSIGLVAQIPITSSGVGSVVSARIPTAYDSLIYSY